MIFKKMLLHGILIEMIQFGMLNSFSANDHGLYYSPPNFVKIWFIATTIITTSTFEWCQGDSFGPDG